jgi:CRP/FNR family transcriptional regulator, anaerobic regulatory protein
MAANPLISHLERLMAISDEDGALITATFKAKSLKDGDYLLRPNSMCKELFFICTGIVRIIVKLDDQTEVTHFFLKENQFCTILRSFNEGTIAAEGIQAACDTEVMYISKTELFSLYKKIPYLEGLIDKITQQTLLDKIELRNRYLGKDSTDRYKLFIIEQADIATRVALSDIASYLGITQQSLSRIRKNIR